ncbi:MAG: prenyltransferase/squalene oxidase repeat-containing protein, partial [Opitutales bacterium]
TGPDETGLKPTQSTVMKLPSLSVVIHLPNPATPKLGNPVKLSMPIKGYSPQLALESTPSTDNPFILRDPAQRARVLERLGGTKESEAVVSSALDWFSRNQEPDGRWSINKHGGQQHHDIAATSFALLCYYGWGAKHTEDGDYRETVEKGLKWLIAQTKPNGDLTNNNQNNGMYDQGVATLALAEAYGLTKDPMVREPLEKAVDFVIKAQNQSHGAWDYRPGSNRKDSSVSGWQLMALSSARLAGIQIPDRPFDLASVWLDKVTNSPHKGIYGYQGPGGNNAAMTALGMFSQQLLGKYKADNPRMLESSKFILKHLPSMRKNNDYYYCYYGCLSMYMNQGEPWETWNPVMRQTLVSGQIKSGKDKGSWDYKGGRHSGKMGRVITTAMATLSLEVYYRYLPSVKIGAANVP